MKIGLLIKLKKVTIYIFKINFEGEKNTRRGG